MEFLPQGASLSPEGDGEVRGAERPSDAARRFRTLDGGAGVALWGVGIGLALMDDVGLALTAFAMIWVGLVGVSYWLAFRTRERRWDSA